MEKTVLEIKKGALDKFKILADLLYFMESGFDIRIEVTKGKKKATKRKVVKKVEGKGKEAVKKKSKQLQKKYVNLRKKFYKSATKMVIKKSDEKHFDEAAKIIIRNNTKIKIFMEAQIRGLSFVSNGKGIFPRVTHLSGSTSEDRLLEYLRKENGDVTVEISDEDKATSLNDNWLYKKRYNKLREKTANLFEAKYVEACQIARKDVAQNLVLDYIENLQEG